MFIAFFSQMVLGCVNCKLLETWFLCKDTLDIKLSDEMERSILSRSLQMSHYVASKACKEGFLFRVLCVHESHYYQIMTH